MKHTSQRDIYNPEFNSAVSALGTKEKEGFDRSKLNYYRFISWSRWFP
jgi:hypothetical protein